MDALMLSGDAQSTMATDSSIQKPAEDVQADVPAAPAHEPIGFVSLLVKSVFEVSWKSSECN
jgi:hypothetical protein